MQHKMEDPNANPRGAVYNTRANKPIAWHKLQRRLVRQGRTDMARYLVQDADIAALPGHIDVVRYLAQKAYADQGHIDVTRFLVQDAQADVQTAGAVS